MNRWNTLRLGNFFPSELQTAANLLDSVADNVNQVLSATRAGLELARALAALAANNPLEAALDALLNQIEEFIDALAEDTGVHAIIIPIQKQFEGLGKELPAEGVDPAGLTPRYDILINDGVFSPELIDNITPNTITFVNTANTATGGNRGFWRTLVQSLRDEGDPARPDFDVDFAVVGSCVIFGSTDISELQEAFAALMQLLFFGDRTDMASRTLPKVEGFRAIAVPVTTTGNIGVQLDWDGVPPVVIKPLFSGDQIINEEIFIIRSTDPKLRERFSWNQVFSRQPKDEITDLQSEGRTSVIARLRNDGLIQRHIDDDPSLVEDTAYYYAMAIRYRIGDNVQPMSPLSAVRRIFYTKRATSSRRGEPPDWWATPSLIQLFPPLEAMIGQMKLFLASLRKRSLSNSGIVDTIEQIITQIENIIAYINAINDQIQEIADQLRALSNATLTGISSTTFSVSKGGMDAWNMELGRRLSDTTDPTRPAFDGNELVAGFVIVGGAPNLPTLDPLLGLLRIFFGGSGDRTSPTITRSEDVIQRISDAMGDPPPTSDEAIIEALGITTTSPDSSVSVAASASTFVFDDAMTPQRGTTTNTNVTVTDAGATTAGSAAGSTTGTTTTSNVAIPSTTQTKPTIVKQTTNRPVFDDAMNPVDSIDCE